MASQGPTTITSSRLQDKLSEYDYNMGLGMVYGQWFKWQSALFGNVLGGTANENTDDADDTQCSSTGNQRLEHERVGRMRRIPRETAVSYGFATSVIIIISGSQSAKFNMKVRP